MSAYKIIDHEYDVIVLGAGGSGLSATTTSVVTTRDAIETAS